MRFYHRVVLLIASHSLMACGPQAGAEVVYNINLVSAGQVNDGNNENFVIASLPYTATASPLVYQGSTWNNSIALADSDSTGGLTNGFSIPDLRDSEGNSSSLEFTLDRRGGSWAFDAGTTSLPVLNNYAFVTTQFFGDRVTSANLTISGLNPDSVLDLYLMSRGDSQGQGGTFTLGGVSKVAAAALATTNSWVEGDNYVQFSDIRPDSDGKVIVELTHRGSSNFDASFGILNGAQIHLKQIPEPSTMALVVVTSVLALAQTSRLR